VDSDNHGHQSEPQTGKRSLLKAYALIISVEITLIVLLRAVHAPWGVLNSLVLLFLIAVLLGKQLLGIVEHIQIVSPAFEQKIKNRYRSETAQLTSLGFSPVFFYGEAFPLIRLFLIYPAFISLIMWLNREVVSIEGGSRLIFGFPVFISNDRSTYSHPLQLGMKFHSVFQDGTILMTKNFVGKTTYGTRVVAHFLKNASISDTWAEHQKQIHALETEGKQIDRKISFQTFSEISYET
jgi:hypothetical protein